MTAASTVSTTVIDHLRTARAVTRVMWCARTVLTEHRQRAGNGFSRPSRVRRDAGWGDGFRDAGGTSDARARSPTQHRAGASADGRQLFAVAGDENREQ